MNTRIIHTKIWKDEFFSELTPTEKLLFIYFLTNERVSIIHCYEVTEREIVFDTGIDRGTIQVFKEKVGKEGRMFFFENYVFLKNASKYETYTGEKNEVKKSKLVKQMSQPARDWFNNVFDTGIDRGIDTPSIGSINHKSEIINHKSKIGGIGKGGENATEISVQEPQPKNYTSLKSLDETVFSEISEKYQVPVAYVRSMYDDLVNYCEGKGKKYSNYYRTLSAWVKRGAIKIASEQSSYKYGVTKI